MIDNLKIKDGNGENAKSYTYSVEEVAEYHGVSKTAVINSRAYSKPQKAKAKKAKGNFITDKLDKLYAYHILKNMWIDGIVTGEKQDVVDTLDINLKEDKRYEVIVKEIKWQ